MSQLHKIIIMCVNNLDQNFKIKTHTHTQKQLSYVDPGEHADKLARISVWKSQYKEKRLKRGSIEIYVICCWSKYLWSMTFKIKIYVQIILFQHTTKQDRCIRRVQAGAGQWDQQDSHWKQRYVCFTLHFFALSVLSSSCRSLRWSLIMNMSVQ
jgi:hypothetical protein